MKKFICFFLLLCIGLSVFRNVGLVVAAPTDVPTFSLSWNIVGINTGVSSTGDPKGIAIDSEDNVYVLTSSNVVEKYDSQGFAIDSWSTPSGGTKGITVDDEDNVYVTTGSLIQPRRVTKYDNTGNQLAQFGVSGSGNGEFGQTSGNISPADIVYNPVSDEIIVADNGNNRIHRWQKDGTFIAAFGTGGTLEGEFNRPKALAVDPNNGNIFVAESNDDSDHQRIQIFTSTGSHLETFGNEGSGDGEFQLPRGMVADSDYLYVADSDNDRIQKFDLDGNFLVEWGVTGSTEGDFNWPERMAINSVGDIYITDRLNSRIQVFTYGGGGPTPTPTPTPDPTSDPQPTTSPTNNSVNSPVVTTQALPPGCSDSKPERAPVLFQVDRSATAATLHFAPVKGTTGYVVSYGLGDTQEQFGTSFGWADSTGVITYPINHLDPKASYSFKVRAQNGCFPGEWSNVLKAKGTSSNLLSRFYFTALWSK